jgi:hypothetical protein
MGVQLEFSGRTGRRALLALLATMAMWLSGGAVQAQAALVQVFPTIQGAGSITGAGYSGCTNGVISNTFAVGCPSASQDTGFFGGTASVTLTATPRGSGGWQFIGWDNCPSGNGNATGTFSASVFQTVNVFPRAHFRDFTGPTITGLTPSFSTTQARTVTFFWGADDLISSFLCQMDSGPFEVCSSGKTYTALTEGTHTFRVRGTDLIGNVGSFVNQDVRILETVLAALAGTPAEGAFLNTKAASFKLTSLAGTSFDCLLDTPAAGVPAFAGCGAKGGDGSLTKSFVAADFPTDGVYQFQARARDGAVIDASPIVRTFTIDTVPPNVINLASPTITDGIVTTALTAAFTFATSEAPGSFLRFECKLDGGDFETCSSGKSFSDLPFGGHTFTVRARDKANNVGPEVSRSWTISARDNDGDGFNQRSDCNDDNAAINPIATDIPDNGIDENCDGVQATDPDRDDDGFQPPADCNDGNPNIKPGVTDTPDNGVDENCDGSDAKTPPLPRVPATVSFNFPAPGKKSTKFTVFLVKTVPAGSKIVARCKGKACGKKPPKQTINNAKGTVRLKKFQRKFKVGSVIEVRVTKSGMEGIVKQVKINKKKNPSIITKCLSGSRVVSCA